jgi:hypothetical protein
MADDDILDDFLSGFDFGGTNPLEPVTADEWFTQRLMEGKNPHIHTIRYNLMKQFEFRDMLKSKGVFMRREVFDAGKVVLKELSDVEFARIVTEDYITSAHHLSLKFAEAENRGKLSMAKVLDILCAHDVMKATIENTFHLRKDLTD